MVVNHANSLRDIGVVLNRTLITVEQLYTVSFLILWPHGGNSVLNVT